MNSMARRMFELVEPIGVIPYSSDEPNEAMFALGFTNYWDTYFAGRAAPLGLVPAEVVDALFYNFAPGEVARHIPRVWRTTTPEAAIAARQVGCVKALRRILGDHVDSPAFARAADLLAHGRDQRTVRGPADVRRAADAADPRRRGGPPLPRRLPAARAPRRRAHRRAHDRGRRRPRGPRPRGPRHGHARQRSSAASTTSPERSSPR